MLWVRQEDPGHSRHPRVREQAFADGMVLGPYLMATHSNGISAIQPYRGGNWDRAPTRRLGCCAARHGRSRSQPLVRACGNRRDAVEIEGLEAGRIRLAPIDDFSAASLHGFLGASATAKTDGWPAYPGMPAVHHDACVIGTMAAHVVLPWVHQVFSNLKTWGLGVYHGPKHLQSYLDEFVFRFNRRRTRHAAFRSLLAIATRVKPVTYTMLILPETAG